METERYRMVRKRVRRKKKRSQNLEKRSQWALEVKEFK